MTNNTSCQYCGEDKPVTRCYSDSRPDGENIYTCDECHANTCFGDCRPKSLRALHQYRLSHYGDRPATINDLRDLAVALMSELDILQARLLTTKTEDKK